VTLLYYRSSELHNYSNKFSENTLNAGRLGLIADYRERKSP
jgi:hypothetical protein